MHRLFSTLSLCLVLAGCSSFDLGGKKDKFTLTVHGVGTNDDSPRSIFRLTLPGQAAPTVFKLVPEFSQQNIAAFHAFPASDGNGYGVTLRLDFRGTENLNMATRTRKGELLLSMVNGQPVDYVTIDQPIGDGIFTIWEGVPETVVQEMEKKYPPIKKLKSTSTGQEMLPTTHGEKKRIMKDLEQERKAEARKAAAPPAPEAPAPDTDNGLPRGAATNKIPLENGMRDKPLPPVQQPQR